MKYLEKPSVAGLATYRMESEDLKSYLDALRALAEPLELEVKVVPSFTRKGLEIYDYSEVHVVDIASGRIARYGSFGSMTSALAIATEAEFVRRNTKVLSNMIKLLESIHGFKIKYPDWELLDTSDAPKKITVWDVKDMQYWDYNFEGFGFDCSFWLCEDTILEEERLVWSKEMIKKRGSFYIGEY